MSQIAAVCCPAHRTTTTASTFRQTTGQTSVPFVKYRAGGECLTKDEGGPMTVSAATRPEFRSGSRLVATSNVPPAYDHGKFSMPVMSPRRKQRIPDRVRPTTGRQLDRILCADDDHDLTRIIKVRLRRCGAEVTRAGSGKEALNAARSHRPSAIITDLGMPCGDGEYLIRRLKSRPSTASIPIVVISGLSDLDRLADVHAMGADAILSKPICFDELIAELATHLNLETSAEAGGCEFSSIQSRTNSGTIRQSHGAHPLRGPAWLNRN